MIRLILQEDNLDSYLKSDEIIDHDNVMLSTLAQNLRGDDVTSTLSNIYYYMRDVIKHSVDIGEKKVISISASQVQQQGHGLCMAKAHLFAALCRSVGIATGFCYQTLEQPSIRFVHGLNAVYYADTREWYRIDIVGSRGHAPVYFETHKELLFYTPGPKLRITEHPVIYSKPHPSMLKYLRAYPDLATALDHLPEELED